MHHSIRNGLAVVFTLLAAVFFSTTANAYSLPGISDSGYPNFTFGSEPNGKKNGQYPIEVSITRLGGRKNPTGYELTAANPQDYDPKEERFEGAKFELFTDSTTSYIGEGNFELFAEFDANQNLTGGWLEISVTDIPFFGITDDYLVRADLELGTWNFSSNLIGFNTTNIQCNPLLNLSCTLSESVYLSLDIKKDGFTGLDGAKSFKAISITTVPVPAAVYLFGTGLLGLIGVARRRKAA